MKRLPQLPALDTQATVKEYFAISGATNGPCWPYVFPLAEWRQYIPTLPSGEWGMFSSSDHASGTGRMYLDTTDNATPETGWSDNETATFTGANQLEMPVVQLNRRLGVVEVIPHVSNGSRYGWTSEQQDKVYHTTDFSTFTLQGDLEVEGAYTSQHPGYGQILEDDDAEWFLKGHCGGEHLNNVILRRDRQDGPWKWDGRRLHINQTQITGTPGRCMAGNPRLFKWQGQWWRLALLQDRSRLTFNTTLSISLVAYPVKGDGDYDTPLAGYQTLVQEASGYVLIGSNHPVVKDGVLYVFYTERNTSSGENRIRVAYNVTPVYSPIPSSIATYVNPYTPIYPDGRLWSESAATTRYVMGRAATTPDFAEINNESGSATVSEQPGGYNVASTATGAIWTWAVKSANAINPASAGGVLLAKWSNLRRSTNSAAGYQIGFAASAAGMASSANASMLFFSSGADERKDGEFFEYRGSSLVTQDVFPYADDFRTHIAFNAQPKDVTLAIFAAGTKFAFFIDGSCAFVRTMHATAIGAVVPFIRAVPQGAVSNGFSWDHFEFAHLEPGQALDGSSVSQITDIVRQEIRAAVRPISQLASDATRHHRELGRLGDTRRAVTNR